MEKRTVKADCVTRGELRKMKPGDVTVFCLPGAAKIDSGRVVANNFSHYMDGRFTTSADYDERTLTVTRL